MMAVVEKKPQGVDMATNRQVQVRDEENLPPEGAAAQDQSVETGITSPGNFPRVGGQSHGMQTAGWGWEMHACRYQPPALGS